MPIVAYDPASPAASCLRMRQDIFLTACARATPNVTSVASSLSLVEILFALYERGYIRNDLDNINDPDRDRLILSKGHGVLALYSILAHKGVIEEEELKGFSRPGSRLGSEPNRLEVPGIEATTGSLGHGLSIGVGMALAAQMDDHDVRVCVILGDGECQEGSVWEAALVAAALKLTNLTVIIDANGIQKFDFVKDVIGPDSLAERWHAFGWNVIEVDGHSIVELERAFAVEENAIAPKVVIARTVKGKGISIMENDPSWHYRMPRKREMTAVLNDLSIDSEEVASWSAQ